MIKYLSASAIILLISGWSFAQAQESDSLPISVQRRIPSDLDSGAFILVNEIMHWKPAETAIIICDMWDQHWCRSATKRVNELAPVVNRVVKIARDKGVLIVHAPSDVVDYYDGTPQRDLGLTYPDRKLGELLDELPNMYVGIAAVIAELGRQPRNAKAFFIKYQDRILFGKDSWVPNEFPTYFRVLETADEYFPYHKKYHAFWAMYGLDLPDEVLKKVYYKNALKIVPGLDKSLFPE